RSAATFGAIDAFTEEVAQFEHTLWSVSVLVRHRATHGGGVNADFFGHLLDHHGLELIDTFFQEILLSSNDGVTDFGDGLLPLLDVLDQLNGALVALLDVIARVLVVGVLGQETLVGGIEPELRQVLIVHYHEPLVAMLNEGNIGLNETRQNLVVALARTRIE